MLEEYIKRTIEHYLGLKMAQGELIFFRLNTGNIIIQSDKPRRFKGCGIKGASDFLAITAPDWGNDIHFIECKSDTGKLSPDQKAF